MLKLANSPSLKLKGGLTLQCAYELSIGIWIAEAGDCYFLFYYKEGLLYLGAAERFDNLKDSLQLVAVNTNLSMRIKLKEILEILNWHCYNYWEED